MAVTLFMTISLGTVPVFAVTIPATKDLSCVAARLSHPNCTANDFEVITTFSAAPNTPPFCIEGESFEFEIDVNLTSKSPDRYDIGFFFGQNKNDPASDTSNDCSVATFPTSFIPSTPPSLTQPWGDLDNKNVCSDFLGGGTVVTRVDKIKVMCQGSATGALLVPYTLVYSQNKGSATSCTGPLDVLPGTSSKCQGNTSATVDGIIKVFSGAYVDVTKQTSPDGDAQSFSYTATGPAGSSVIAVTNPTSWSPLTGGTYTPSSYTNATNSVTVSLSDGQTARFLISALDTDQTLTITETANADWDTTAKISCAAVTGTPSLTTNNNTREITAALSKTNSAAACTVTNEKLARVTIVKQSNGGTGSFNFSGGTNGLPANLSLDTTTGNPKNSATYKVNANYAATAITEALPAGWTLNSTSTTCTDGSTTFGALSGGTLTIPAVNVTPGNNITCTFVNDKNANITVNKSLLPSGDNGKFNLLVGAVTVASNVGNSGTGSTTIPANTPITVSETAGTATSLADYNATYNCSGGYSATNISGTSINIPAGSVAPGLSTTCTFTNSRKTATVTLQKTWVNALVNNSVDINATSLTPYHSVADTANETDTGTAQPVYVGSALTLGETFTSGNASNYSSSLACTGTSGLSANTLTVGSTDTVIVCTYTNALQPPNLTVLKTAFGVTSGSSAKFGQEIPYAITVTNAGAGKAWNTSVTDALSPYTAFKLNSLTFADGSISSGLSMAGSTTSYSYDNGATWTTTPPADLGGGYNGNVTNWMIVFDPTVQMNSSNAFFTIAYKVVVK